MSKICIKLQRQKIKGKGILWWASANNGPNAYGKTPEKAVTNVFTRYTYPNFGLMRCRGAISISFDRRHYATRQYLEREAKERKAEGGMRKERFFFGNPG